MGGTALFLALRRLRAPLILLVTVFAAGIVGLVLIPGVDASGGPWHLTVFQALYFMTYTASTIGFGEIPREFSTAQRVWVTGIIYASVIGWAYLVASLLALSQDQAFRNAITSGGFRRRVRAIREPFHLICGFGETGMLVGKALDALGGRFVAVEIDPTRVQELDLLDLQQDAPGLAGDAKLPENLLAAGLSKRECRGVLALTNDDQANLAVAMSVRLIHPGVPVLARAMSPETGANMASFGTDHIVNPFAKFGGYLALAIDSPGSHRLLSWVTGLPGTTLKPETAPPRGHWIVCGYGRFGREVVRAFRREGLEITIIDPEERTIEGLRAVRGHGTDAEPLRLAGVERSVGIVAGTDDDVNNLSIAVTARELNPKLFTILRQNLQANRALFDAFRADITMVSSEIVANECLALINTPLLSRFLAVVRNKDDAWADAVIERMQAVMGVEAPEIWCVDINAAGAPALHQVLATQGAGICVGDLARDPSNRDERLACLPVYIARETDSITLPGDDELIETGDQVLFAGTPSARRAQWAALRNVNVRDYLLNGVDVPDGWIWRWLDRRRARG